MLTKKFIADRKRALLKEKARLEQDISKRKKFEDYGDSEDDSAQGIAAYGKNLSANVDFQRMVDEINAALTKIENGSYGQCDKGPERIEEERLMAFAAATVCIKHQRELDQRRVSGRTWFKPWTWRK